MSSTTATRRSKPPQFPLLVVLLAVVPGVHGLASIATTSTGTSTSTSTSTNTEQLTQPKPWRVTEIDYGPANEFIEDFYRREKYFPHDQAQETIHNAREGVLPLQEGTTRSTHTGLHLEEPSLSKCGFQLIDLEKHSQKDPGVTAIDWDDLRDIKTHFFPVIQEQIEALFGKDKIQEIVFWSPNKRRADYVPQPRDANEIKDPPKSSYVTGAHIDTDINAFETMEQFLQTLEASRFPGTDHVPKEKILKALRNGQRFKIINAWRNINPTTPVLRAPLAFRPIQYREPNGYFPNGTPQFDQSFWYTFPEMTSNELLLFCQYDRDAAQPSDVWHCALQHIGADDPTIPPRDSFDFPAFIVFKDDNVSEDRDRLRPDQLVTTSTTNTNTNTNANDEDDDTVQNE